MSHPVRCEWFEPGHSRCRQPAHFTAEVHGGELDVCEDHCWKWLIVGERVRDCDGDPVRIGDDENSLVKA